MTRFRTATLAGSLALGLLLPTLAGAQTYQWRDNNGRVVYSDQPPPPNIAPGNILKSPKAPPKAVATATPASTATSAAKEGSGTSTPGKADAKSTGPKTIAEREADYKKRQAEAAEKAEKDAQTAAADSRRQEQCNNMRQSLAALESGQRVRRFNDKGEPYFVDDAERARDIEKARREMGIAKCG